MGCKLQRGSPDGHTSTFFDWSLCPKNMLPSNVSLQSILYFKSCIALVTRRVFPLAAAAAMQAVFVGWSCAARKSSAGKKIVRQGKKTRLQSSIRTNARKCLPPRQETLQNRQKRQSRSRQAGNHCSWSSQVAKWLYHANTTQLCQLNIDSCDL